MTTLGKNVVLGLLTPLVLHTFGFFNWTSIFVFQTLVLCVVIAVRLSPRRPDPDMDPVTAACMCKKQFLPNDAPTHLTMVMYFESCPEKEVVTQAFSKVMPEYPRFVAIETKAETKDDVCSCS